MTRNRTAAIALSLLISQAVAGDEYDDLVCRAIEDPQEKRLCVLESKESLTDEEERWVRTYKRWGPGYRDAEKYKREKVKRQTETRILNVDYAMQRGSFVVTYQVYGYDPGTALRCTIYGKGKPGSHYASILHRFSATANKIKDIKTVTVRGLQDRRDLVTARCYAKK